MMDFPVLLLECRPDAFVHYGPDKLIPTARSADDGDEWAHIIIESMSVRPRSLLEPMHKLTCIQNHTLNAADAADLPETHLVSPAVHAADSVEDVDMDMTRLQASGAENLDYCLDDDTVASDQHASHYSLSNVSQSKGLLTPTPTSLSDFLPVQFQPNSTQHESPQDTRTTPSPHSNPSSRSPSSLSALSLPLNPHLPPPLPHYHPPYSAPGLESIHQTLPGQFHSQADNCYGAVDQQHPSTSLVQTASSGYDPIQPAMYNFDRNPSNISADETFDPYQFHHMESADSQYQTFSDQHYPPFDHQSGAALSQSLGSQQSTVNDGPSSHTIHSTFTVDTASLPTPTSGSQLHPSYTPSQLDQALIPQGDSDTHSSYAATDSNPKSPFQLESEPSHTPALRATPQLPDPAPAGATAKSRSKKEDIYHDYKVAQLCKAHGDDPVVISCREYSGRTTASPMFLVVQWAILCHNLCDRYLLHKGERPGARGIPPPPSAGSSKLLVVKGKDIGGLISRNEKWVRQALQGMQNLQNPEIMNTPQNEYLKEIFARVNRGEQVTDTDSETGGMLFLAGLSTAGLST